MAFVPEEIFYYRMKSLRAKDNRYEKRIDAKRYSATKHLVEYACATRDAMTNRFAVSIYARDTH